MYMPQMVQRQELKTKLYMAHQTTGNSSVICFPGVNCNVTIKLCVSSKTRRCRLYADCHLCGMKWHPYLVFLGGMAYSPCWDQIKKRHLEFKWILCFWEESKTKQKIVCVHAINRSSLHFLSRFTRATSIFTACSTCSLFQCSSVAQFLAMFHLLNYDLLK